MNWGTRVWPGVCGGTILGTRAGLQLGGSLSRCRNESTRAGTSVTPGLAGKTCPRRAQSPPSLPPAASWPGAAFLWVCVTRKPEESQIWWVSRPTRGTCVFGDREWRRRTDVITLHRTDGNLHVSIFSAKGDTGRTGRLQESRVSPWGTRRPGGGAGWGCTGLPAPLL